MSHRLKNCALQLEQWFLWDNPQQQQRSLRPSVLPGLQTCPFAIVAMLSIIAQQRSSTLIGLVTGLQTYTVAAGVPVPTLNEVAACCPDVLTSLTTEAWQPACMHLTRWCQKGSNLVRRVGQRQRQHL